MDADKITRRARKVSFYSRRSRAALNGARKGWAKTFSHRADRRFGNAIVAAALAEVE